MADVKKFPRVIKAFKAYSKAYIELQKAVAACAGPDDAIRVSKINAAMGDTAALHAVLKSVYTVERAAAGDPPDDTDGGGQTPDK